MTTQIDDPPARHCAGHYTRLAILFCAMVVMCIWTWGKWADPVTDFGREVYVPWRLAEGQVLYRDIHYFNGPLSPYFNAACFRVFGTSLRTLVVVNLAIVVAIVGLLYALLCATGGRYGATLACVAFITLFAFGHFIPISNYNYICPYSHELSHGLVLSLAAIACLWRYSQRQRLGWLAGTGFLFGTVFLTKAEVCAALALALATGLLGVYLSGRAGLSRSIREAAIFLLAALIPVAVAFALLCTAMPAGEAAAALAGSWKWLGDSKLTNLRFFHVIMGTDDTANSARRIAIAVSAYVLLFLPAIAWGLTRRRNSVVRLTLALLAMGLVLCANVQRLFEDSLRPLPVLLLVIAVILAAQMVRMRGSPHADKAILRLVLAMFGLGMLAKILLNVHLYHYGFALAMPGTVVLIAALSGWLPASIDARSGDGQALRMAVTAVLVVTGGVHLFQMGRLQREQTVQVSTGADRFFADGRGKFVNEVTAELAKRSSSGQTLVMAPEGLIVNYLARIPTPLKDLNFTPPAVIMFGEDEMLRDMQSHPPDFIGLVHVDSSAEYNAAFFGKDYATSLGNWIRNNYGTLFTTGGPADAGDKFGIKLLGHKSSNGGQ